MRTTIPEPTRADALVLAMLGPDDERPKSLKKCRKRMRRMRQNLYSRSLVVPPAVAVALRSADEAVTARCLWCRLCEGWRI